MKYDCEYRYRQDFGMIQHNWIIVGARIGLNLHISDLGDKNAKEFGERERYSGGIETHNRTPPDYMQNVAPSHKECAVLGCPCCHAGSSSAATERWIPLWQAIHGAPDEHAKMFDALIGELESRETGNSQPTARETMAAVMAAKEEAQA